MVRVATIASTELVRMLRDRSNIFFVFIFPLLLVVLIGAQFGGSMQTELGVVAPGDDPDAAALIERIDGREGLRTTRVEDEQVLRDEVARGVLAAGVVIPDGYSAALREAEPIEVSFIGSPDASSRSLETIVEGAVAQDAAPGTAALVAAELTGRQASQLREIAVETGSQVADVEVEVTALGEDELAQEFAGLGQFDLGASSQLFLFTFLTSLAGGAALIQARQYGVARRMLSTSTPIGQIVLGQAGGRFLVALLQAGYIVAATLLLFQVNWGDPVASGLVVLLFCLVSAGAGLLVGATFRNDSQAAGAGVGLGLGFAALGGSMMPLELFPPVMRAIARITPHAWANEAMAELVRRDGGVGDVLPQLTVLAGFAVVLFVLAAVRLQQVLTR